MFHNFISIKNLNLLRIWTLQVCILQIYQLQMKNNITVFLLVVVEVLVEVLEELVLGVMIVVVVCVVFFTVGLMVSAV